MKTRSQAIESLNKAIDAYTRPTGPGLWSAQYFYGAGRPAIALTYSVDMEGTGPHPHPDLVTGDEPCKLWGGSEILSAAGLESFNGVIDSYTDLFGDDVFCDSSVIEVIEDEL